MLNKLAASELVLNDDGSVYHLNLLPEDIALRLKYAGVPVELVEVDDKMDNLLHLHLW